MHASNTGTSPATDTQDREIVITRLFDAPRGLVWKAWTDPVHIARWWGPNGFTTTIHEMDVRPGGVWRHTMHGPDGTDYPNESVFVEVIKPERISFSHTGGRKGDPAVQFQSTWTFEPEGEKTRLTLRMVFASVTSRDFVVKTHRAIEGGNETLGRLADHLESMTAKTTFLAEPGKPTIVMSRVLDAPRRLVFEAYTNPRHISRWWGPRRLTAAVDKMDVRPGGAWRFVQRAPGGKEFAFHGTYREIVPPERIIATFEFEGMPGHVIVDTVTLEEHEGKTKLTVSSLFQSVEDRDGMLESGMESGASESMDRLAELLRGIA
jgi:uncharacterized protein YndB with AHSA1/START domain